MIEIIWRKTDGLSDFPFSPDEERVAVFIFHLFSGFAVNRGDNGSIGEE